MEDKRMHWLDSGRGIAIATTMFVHLMRWTLLAFATWTFTDGSFANWEVGIVRGIEGYLRICWLSVFAFSIVLTHEKTNYNFTWLFNRFLILIIAPTAAWMLSAKSIGYLRWEIIQSLFIFNLIGIFIYSWKTTHRWILYSITILACLLIFPHKEALAQTSLFWSIMVGGIPEHNFFNVLYGLPAFFFFFEQYKLFFDNKNNTLNVKALVYITLACVIVMLVAFLTGFNSLEPRHYPPQLVEYLGSFAFTNCCHIYLFLNKEKINPKGFLAILGRYSFVHFLGHLLLGAIIFEWLGLWKNQFSFTSGFLFSIGLLILLWKINVWILDYRLKRGYDVNQRK